MTPGRKRQSAESPDARLAAEVARLAELQAQIATLVTASRKEATRVVEEARAETEQLLARLEGELRAEQGRVRKEMEARRKHALEQITEEARQHLACLQQIYREAMGKPRNGSEQQDAGPGDEPERREGP